MITETHWYDDPDELLTFVRWFFEGHTSPRIKSEIFEVLEKPWKWDGEYWAWQEDRDADNG